MEKELPKGWVEVSLKDVTNNVKGKKPNIQSEVEFEGSIPYMDIKALEYNKIRQYADVASSKLFEEGDVAMVWDGARSGWVSKANLGAIGSTLVAFKPIEFNSDYLYYYLLEKYPFINSKTRGVGIPHVDPTVLWELPFPLSPKPQQDRIVAKLDSLFAELERVKEGLAKIPILMKKFRKAVLTQAVTGKLTEEWRVGKELPYVEDYIQEIKNNVSDEYRLRCDQFTKSGNRKPKKQSANKKSERGHEAMPFLPSNWLYERAEDLTYLITDGVHFKPNYINEGIPFLSVKNVRPFKINIRACKFISESDHLEYIKRCKPEKGDILYTKVGATYGYAARVDFDFDFSIYVSLALLKPSKLLSSEYLELLFNSPVIFNQANNRVSGSGVPDLHLIEIRDFKLPIPVLEEQQEIVRRLEELFAKADVIEARYTLLKEKIEHLPQAILAKAFRGELVEQLPADGDARELLEEIKKMKAGLVKGAKKV